MVAAGLLQRGERARRAFGPARGAKMEILVAGWLGLAPPFPGTNYVCYALRGV